jgi:hypothetical protein
MQRLAMIAIAALAACQDMDAGAGADDPSGEAQEAIVAKGLYASFRADRSGAQALASSLVIPGVAYVFAAGYSSVSMVDFYNIDSSTTVHRTERVAAFDFNGTASDGTAIAYDFSSLAAGSHTIHIRVTHTDGTVETATGAFTHGSAPPPPSVPTIGGCPVFTADDAWNTDISTAASSSSWTTTIGNKVGAINIHPDFGGNGAFGIPFNVVPQTQARLPMSFDISDESDPGPYPFPPRSSVKIEGGDPTCADDGDCHVLTVQQGVCQLYEGWACRTSGSGWHCGSGARFDMTKKSEGQRPAGWTSADAAGLSVLAGLIRYDEVAVQREIKHAIRFTLKCTRAQFIYPASHQAVSGSCNPNDPTSPPMGFRMRLRAGFDISGFGADTQVILRAMKKYGIILADNGSNFFFQAEADPRWSDAIISDLKRVPASAFEALAFN